MFVFHAIFADRLWPWLWKAARFLCGRSFIFLQFGNRACHACSGNTRHLNQWLARYSYKKRIIKLRLCLAVERWNTETFGDDFVSQTDFMYIAVRLFSNRSKMTSKCGKNKKVVNEALTDFVINVSSYYILTSSVFYYWTDARQHGRHQYVCS